MKGVGLADEADGRRAGIEDEGEALVVLAAPGALVMPKAVRVALVRGGGEEGAVGRVGAGPAALDVVEAEIVQDGGDAQLLGGGELDALGLGAVAERGVDQG